MVNDRQDYARDGRFYRLLALMHEIDHNGLADVCSARTFNLSSPLHQLEKCP